LPLIYLAMLMVICVMIKAEERVFYPVLELAGVLSAGILLAGLAEEAPAARPWKITLAVLLLCLSLLEIARLHKRSVVTGNELKVLSNSWSQLKKEAAGKDIILDNQSVSLLSQSTHPFQKMDVSEFHRIYLNDMGSLSIVEPYKSYLAKECQCNMDDASGFYRFIQGNADRIRIISTGERLDFLSAYFSNVHGLNLSFEKADTRPVISKPGMVQEGFVPLYQYQIRTRDIP